MKLEELRKIAEAATKTDKSIVDGLKVISDDRICKWTDRDLVGPILIKEKDAKFYLMMESHIDALLEVAEQALYLAGDENNDSDCSLANILDLKEALKKLKEIK